VAFGQMNAAFQEIASGAASQADATLSISDSVGKMNALAEQLANAGDSLREQTEQTASLSGESMQQLIA